MVFLATVIVGVLAVSALLGWILLRTATSVERARRDPRFRRRLLLLYGSISALGAVFCVVLFATSPSSPQLMSCLLMELLNILSLINLARILKAPSA